MKKLILVFFAMMVSVTVASAREVPHYRCGPWTLRGDYGVLVSGTRPSGPGGPLELMVGTAIDTFNGDGTFSQIDNVHGAISGYPASAVDRPGSGTYTLNENCTGTMTLNNEGAPPLTLSIVVVDEGREIRIAVVDPQPVMVTSTARKIH